MKPTRLRFLSSALMLGFSPVLYAQSLYWNPSPLDNTWDATSTHWAESSGAAPSLAWTADATAIFDQAATYTVTLSGAQSASAFQFTNGSVTVDLDGTSQTLANLAITTPTASTTGTFTNGSLTLNGASDLVITPGVTTGGRTALIDASDLSSLTISKSDKTITVGGQGSGATPGNYGMFKLSAVTNSITASAINVGTNGGANASGIINKGDIELGASNTLNANTWTLGNTRDGGIVRFRPGLENPSVTLRGQNGTSAVTKITVGQNAAGGTGVGISSFELAAGSVDILVTDLVVSRGGSGSTASGPAVNGYFSIGGGTLGATNIWLSKNESGGRNSTNLSHFYQVAGNVTVNSLTFGETSNSLTTGTLPTFNSQYTLTSGILSAAEIKAGPGTFATGSTRRINFNGGTITHYDSSTDLTINGVTGTGGTIGIALGTDGTPTIDTATDRVVTLGSFTSISGSGSLLKTGPGQLVMNNTANTSSGEFRPVEGSVVVGATNALAGSVLILDADDTGTLSFNGTTTLALGGLNGSRNLSLLNNAAATQDLTLGSANSADFTGVITGAKSIRKVGAGNQIYDPGTLHSASMVGFNVSGGTLELLSGNYTVTGSAATAQPDSISGFTVSRGGTFRMDGANVTATAGTYLFTAGNTGGGNSSFILDSGTLNANGREVLNAYGAAGTTTINGGLFICNGFKVTQTSTGTGGTLNLNGGTLRLNRLYGDANTSTINFNGGILQARIDRSDFIDTTITNARVQVGGAVIDSNGVNITIPEALLEDAGSAGGGLTKIGIGSLTLTAANAYTGPTLVNEGRLIVNADHTNATGEVTVGDAIGDPNSAILGGTGSIPGAVTLDDDGAVAPGALAGSSIGTLTASSGVSGSGSLMAEVDGATADKLIVGGTIDISAMKLDLSVVNDPTESVYVIVDASSAITGAEFAAVTGVPAGYSVVYNYDDGVDAHNIAITGGSVTDLFVNWAENTHGLAGENALPGADPDKDGLSNLVEYALGLNPNASSQPPGSFGTGILSFDKGEVAKGDSKIVYQIESSTNLVSWEIAEAAVDGADSISFTLPAGQAKEFARLKVTKLP